MARLLTCISMSTVLPYTPVMLLYLAAVAGCEPATGHAESAADERRHRRVAEADRQRLQDVGWERRVGQRLGLWVSVAQQRLYGIRNERILFAYPCSTADKGVGNRANSYQTPLGWHEIDERFGEGLPVGAIFRERQFTGDVWTPEHPTTEDLILTRILWLRGIESGVNAGPGIDSHDRYIYIHGTPEEDRIGTPASKGCVRLLNKDVVRLFDVAATGTPVLITEW